MSIVTVSMLGAAGVRNLVLYAIDANGQVSAGEPILYEVPQASNIPSVPLFTFGNSLTDASLVLNWENPETTFGLAGYEISYDDVVATTSSNTITISPLPLNWIGDKIFTVKTIDMIGPQNKSSGVSVIVNKERPGKILSARADVIDNTVMLYWTLPDRTSLPISHVLVKKGDVWETAENIGEKSGTFTTIFERQAGTYNYQLAVVDTDMQESIPYSLAVTVSQPPDFTFNGDFTSQFTGTAVNAKVETGTVTMPVNLTSTFENHFTSKGWSGPQAQIDAFYPIYAQPSLSSGYYEEIIDFGSTFGSSQVTITTTGVVIAGSPIVGLVMSYSNNGTTFSTPTTDKISFITNFRYIKIKVSVSQSGSDKAIYALNYLNVRLDSKIKDDAGNTVCSELDPGALVNFNREFVDVTSITVTPKGSIPLLATAAHKDIVIPATYTVVSNVCTITTSQEHGFLEAGARVRLSFSSGLGTSGLYNISSVISTTQYTVSLISGNTSGNVNTYAESMYLYLFDTNGVRASGSISWAVKGY